MQNHFRLRPRFKVEGGLGPAYGETPTLPDEHQPFGTTVVSAMKSIARGIFGIAEPRPVDPVPTMDAQPASPYAWHQGDVFNPGTGQYVFESEFETPLQSIWGGGGAAQAFLRVPNTFAAIQQPQVWSNPNVRVNGIGGLVAGTMVLQPLESEDGA